MNIFFTSDTHYGHKNIVKGCSEWSDLSCCRDFATLKEHDNTIIENINRVVGQDDILYHLGDWSFGGDDNVWKFRRRINCNTIHFIGGNHDHHIRRNKVLTTDSGLLNSRSLFTTYQELLEKVIGGKQDFVLCHYPILSWHKLRKGSIHLYGHTHRELGYHPQAICVSMDVHPEFRPFHMDEIKQTLAKNQSKHYDDKLVKAASRSYRPD